MVMVSDEETTLDIRNSIQTEKEKKRPCPPLIWPPSILMNQQSLELCTESLGSETGSDGFSTAEEFYSHFAPFPSKRDSFEEKAGQKQRKMELTTMVNYHRSIGRDSPPPRSFPPPLSSAFIQMRPFRRDGHLVLKAVSVPSHNYLHAERHSGRLVLSFIYRLVDKDEDEDEDKDEEDEEEEIQVDRGTVVEVKVSKKPQLVNGATPAEVLRSSLVINKFVVGEPITDDDESTVAVGGKRICFMTTVGRGGCGGGGWDVHVGWIPLQVHPTAISPAVEPSDSGGGRGQAAV